MGWSHDGLERQAVRRYRHRLNDESKEFILGKSQMFAAKATDPREFNMHARLLLWHDNQEDKGEQMDRRLDLQERALELKSAQSQEGQYDIDAVVAEAEAAHAEYGQPPPPEPPPGA